MYVDIDKLGKIRVNVDGYDICATCQKVDDCPLVNALSSETVVLRYQEIEITCCGHYVEQTGEIEDVRIL